MTIQHGTKIQILAIVLLAMAAVACFNFFSPSCVGDNCGAQATQITGSATPTPSASASPTTTPVAGSLNCRVDFLVFDSGATVLSVNETSQFSLTPWQRVETGELVKVADSCNIPKAEFVAWTVNSPVASIAKLPGGFAADVRRVGIGKFVVTAKFEGREISREVN